MSDHGFFGPRAKPETDDPSMWLIAVPIPPLVGGSEDDVLAEGATSPASTMTLDSAHDTDCKDAQDEDRVSSSNRIDASPERTSFAENAEVRSPDHFFESDKVGEWRSNVTPAAMEDFNTPTNMSDPHPLADFVFGSRESDAQEREKNPSTSHGGHRESLQDDLALLPSKVGSWHTNGGKAKLANIYPESSFLLWRRCPTPLSFSMVSKDQEHFSSWAIREIYHVALGSLPALYEHSTVRIYHEELNDKGGLTRGSDRKTTFLRNLSCEVVALELLSVVQDPIFRELASRTTLAEYSNANQGQGEYLRWDLSHRLSHIPVTVMTLLENMRDADVRSFQAWRQAFPDPTTGIGHLRLWGVNAHPANRSTTPISQYREVYQEASASNSTSPKKRRRRDRVFHPSPQEEDERRRLEHILLAKGDQWCKDAEQGDSARGVSGFPRYDDHGRD